jgi:hypothetical protein
MDKTAGAFLGVDCSHNVHYVKLTNKNQKSKIKNQKSKIKNQKSRIVLLML